MAMARDSIQSTHSKTYSHVNLNGYARAVFGDVNINAADFAFARAANQDEQKRLLLRSLYFERMRSRKAQIDERAGSPKHVEWIWRTNFLTWLEGPRSLYWLTGRPGSGKSTLMSHLSSSARTKKALSCNGGQWTVVNFFFDFRAGDSLANSIEGLLRSLLFQVVRLVPGVFECIDHDLFEGPALWTLRNCLDNLCEAIETSSHRICAFIDGLDEFEGSYARLIEVIRTIEERVTGIKICLASRPYLPFRDSFGASDSLAMQDYNNESIEMYTSAKWSDHQIDHQASLPQELAERIRIKANGVFLWVRLAVDELVPDFLNGKSVPQLHQQLEEMPTEVKDMYQRALERLSEPHQQEAAAILYIIMQREAPLRVDLLYAALDALKANGYTGPMILPIGSNTNNMRRLLAILGDVTDQVLSKTHQVRSRDDHTNGTGVIPPDIILEGSTIRCRREQVPCVTLAHETLRSFLLESPWLMSKISPMMSASRGHKFWVDLYAAEIRSGMLSGLLSPSLDSQLRRAAVEYGHRVAKLTWETRGNFDADFDHLETELLTFLQKWSNWSPLLLFAVRDIFHHLSESKSDPSLSNDQLFSLFKSAAVPLHFAICVFQTCEIYRGTRTLNDDPTDRVFFRYSNCANCAISSDVRSAPSPIMCLNAMLAISHSLEDIVPPLLMSANPSNIASEQQMVFDWAWERFLMKDAHTDSVSARDDINHSLALLSFLTSTGCKLTGRHLSSFAPIWVGCLPRGLGKFVAKCLSRDDLSHMHEPDHTHPMVRHLTDWMFYCWFCIGLSDPADLLFALIDRGASFEQYKDYTGETFIAACVKRCWATHPGLGPSPAEILRLVIEAGGDPYEKGKSGNAFEMAAQKVDLVNSTSSAEEIEAYHNIIDVLQNHRKDMSQSSSSATGKDTALAENLVIKSESSSKS